MAADGVRLIASGGWIMAADGLMAMKAGGLKALAEAPKRLPRALLLTLLAFWRWLSRLTLGAWLAGAVAIVAPLGLAWLVTLLMQRLDDALRIAQELVTTVFALGLIAALAFAVVVAARIVGWALKGTFAFARAAFRRAGPLPVFALPVAVVVVILPFAPSIETAAFAAISVAAAVAGLALLSFAPALFSFAS